jgi:hypothetical protein
MGAVHYTLICEGSESHCTFINAHFGEMIIILGYRALPLAHFYNPNHVPP